MRINLAKDPSLRSGSTAAFRPLQGAVLSLTEDYSFYGKYGLKVAKSASNGSGVEIAQPISVVGQKPYAFAWYVRLPVTIPHTETANVIMRVEWMNSLQVVMQTNDTAILSVDNDDEWFRIGGVWTAPMGATLAHVSLFQPLPGSSGSPMVVDALLIEQADYVGGYFDNLSSDEKYRVVNKALSASPQVINGVRLGADIILNDLIFNTIDEDDTVWVITDLDGWWGQTAPDMPDIPRGTEDGSYDVEGRLTSRTVTLTGFFIPRDNEGALSASIDRLVSAINLVRSGGWLHANESPTKAAWVRLVGRPTIRTTNARGKTEFQVQLRAGDPIKYHWNDADPDGYTYSTLRSSGASDVVENIGTADVTGLFTIEGPVGPGTLIYNATTNRSMVLQEPLRGAGLMASVKQAEAFNNIATVYTEDPHGLRVGDEVSLLGMVIPFSETDTPRVVTAVSRVVPYSFSFDMETDDIDKIDSPGQVALIHNDVIEIDTYNRSVTFNGEVAGHRHRLTTLTEWITFAPGQNVIQFKDEVPVVGVLEKQLSGNVVTLKTDGAHQLIPGEPLVVDLPETRTLSKKSLTSGQVTLTTVEPHGFSEGDKIDIQSIESSVVIRKSAEAGSVTLTTVEGVSHGISVNDDVVVDLPTTANPVRKSATTTHGTVTMPVGNDHGFSVGDTIDVALPASVNVIKKQISGNQAILTTASPHNYAIGDTINVAMPPSANVTGKARSGSQVIITTGAPHGFSVGDEVHVTLPTSASPTGNFVGASATSLVTVTTSAAHRFSVGDRVSISGSSRSSFNGEKVVESVASTTFTFRDWTLTGNVSVAAPANQITNLTNQSYNGVKTIVAVSGTEFTYNL